MNKINRKIINVIVPSFIVSIVGFISCYLNLSIYLVISLIVSSGIISGYLCNKLFIVNDNVVEHVLEIKNNDRVVYNNISYVNSRHISKDKIKKRVKKRDWLYNKLIFFYLFDIII